MPNQHLPLIRQCVANVKRGKPRDSIFGSGGGPSSVDVAVGPVVRRQSFADSDVDGEARLPAGEHAG